MRSIAGTLAAPFPYFGGKALACETVWAALGDPVNYVEPFAGSAAMLLGRPNPGKVETINDADGFVANFWRAARRSGLILATRRPSLPGGRARSARRPSKPAPNRPSRRRWQRRPARPASHTAQ